MLIALALAVDNAPSSGDGKTLVAVIAGGAITFLTATIGQLLGEKFKRSNDAKAHALTRTESAADRQRDALDALLRAELSLETALGRDRTIDLEQANDERAQSIRDADSRFRSLLPQVESEEVVLLGKAWRAEARAYAATRPGDREGPTVREVNSARDRFDDAIGVARRQLDK